MAQSRSPLDGKPTNPKARNKRFMSKFGAADALFHTFDASSPQAENVAKSTSKWVFSPGAILARRAARIIHTPACDWSELGIPHFPLPFRPPSDAHDDSTPGCRFRYNR